ncbi:MAG: helix-turn-helix transcriptional regulator [Nonomuraea sp.]|nr:helix-turn-helix transcriptional regulator [Nonomuraea sp.]
MTVYNPGQVQSCTTRTPAGTPFACVSWYVPPATTRSLTGGTLIDFERPVVRAPGLRKTLLTAARTLTADPAPTSNRTPAADPIPTSTRTPAGDAALVKERLTVLLLRLFDLAAGSRPRAQGPAPGDARMAAVLDRLRADLSAAPSLADLAGEAGMSREHLVRSFTRATGCPPYAWHLQARIAEGRRLLRRGRPVADVAHSLGFADQAHFHRHFTAAYAITPGRYRRLVNI